MNGIAAQLPLVLDPDGGYALLQNLKDVATQNLKMIVLTSPGERMMMPGFGSGVRKLLFENQLENTGVIQARIRSQVAKYLPWVSIENISFIGTPESNLLNIQIKYNIPKISFSSDVISIPIQ